MVSQPNMGRLVESNQRFFRTKNKPTQKMQKTETAARINTFATLLLAISTSLLWSLLDQQGYLSRAVGWSSIPFNIVLGLDVAIWATLLFLVGAQEWLEFFGAMAIGGLILTGPHTFVSFLETTSFLPFANYKAKVAEVTQWTIVVGAFFALLNDCLSRRDEQIVCHEANEIRDN